MEGDKTPAPSALAQSNDPAVREEESSSGSSPTSERHPAEVADGVERSLDPRSVQLERLTGWIAAAVVSLILLGGVMIPVLLPQVPFWLKGLLAALWVIAALLMMWSAHFWPDIEHRHASYRVDQLGIRIRRGVLWKRVISVPASRIQHIDVSQGPLERSYGLGTLILYTAGAEYARVAVRGLDHTTALRIRDHLLPRERDDAV